MKRVTVIITSLCALLFLTAPLYAEEAENSITPGMSTAKGTVGTSNGSFQTGVSIQVPKYFGVTPNLSVNYSSATHGKNGLLGLGQGLSGFETLSMNAKGRFELNGEELRHCEQVSNRGLSCAGGGTHTLQTDTALRIVYAGNHDFDPSHLEEGELSAKVFDDKLFSTRAEGNGTWVVTRSDGTNLTFVQINAQHYRTWFLSSVEDLFGHRVDYQWNCLQTEDVQIGDSTGTTLECLPGKITYGKNNYATVAFHYENRVDTVLDGSTAFRDKNLLNLLTHRLRNIVVYSGSKVQRGYQFLYDTGAETGRSLLSQVVLYGNDAIINAGQLRGGSTRLLKSYSYKFQLTQKEPISGEVLFERPTDCNNKTWGACYGQPLSFDQDGDGVSEPRVTKSWKREEATLQVYARRPNLTNRDIRARVVQKKRHTSTRELSHVYSGDFLAFDDGVIRPDQPTFGLQSAEPARIQTDEDDSIDNDPYNDPDEDIIHSYTELLIGDFNGDGKDEACSTGTYQDEFEERYLQCPAILNSKKLSTFGSQRLTADFNGDGMTDLYLPSLTKDGKVGVRFTTFGNDQDVIVLPPEEVAENFKTFRALENRRIIAADVNGDGLSDLIWAVVDDNLLLKVGVKVSLGNGSFETVPFESDFDPQANKLKYRGIDQALSIQSGDFDGDGRADVLLSYKPDLVEDKHSYRCFHSGGKVEGLLTEVLSTLGGREQVSYQVATLRPIKKVFVVQSITTHSGTSAPSVISYQFSDGLYSLANNRILGFQTVLTQIPAAGNSSTNVLTKSVYHVTDDALAGQIERMERYELQGGNRWVLLDKELYSYNTEGINERPFRALLSRVQQFTYGIGEVKATEKEFGYNSYGQVQYEIDRGLIQPLSNLPVSGDETRTERRYNNNFETFLVGLPSLERVYAGELADNSQKLSDTSFWYDDQDWNAPSVKGLLTRKQVWLKNESSERFIPEVRNTYDGEGRLTIATDAAGRETRYGYEPRFGILTNRETNNLQQSIISSGYNQKCGAFESTQDINGGISTTSFDAFCRPMRSTTPGGSYERFSYHDSLLGQPGFQFHESFHPVPNGEIVERSYFDGLGRTYLTAKTSLSASGDLSCSVTRFDSRGREIQSSLPYSCGSCLSSNSGYVCSLQAVKLHHSVFDNQDRTIESVEPDGAKTTFRYTLNTTETRDPSQFVRKSVVDIFGNEIERYENGVLTISREFDVEGRLVKTTLHGDGSEVTSSLLYDSLGRRVEISDSSAGTVRTSYYDTGEVRDEVDAEGNKVANTLDPLGRIRVIRTTDASGNEEVVQNFYDEEYEGLHYANKGHLTRVYDSNGQTTYNYDRAGNIIYSARATLGTAFVVRRNYDPSGSLLSEVRPDGYELRYHYGHAGQLLTLSGYQNGSLHQRYVTNTEYTVAGKVRSRQLGNGVTETNEFDSSRSWLNRRTIERGGSVLLDLHMTERDPVGRIKTLSSNRPEWNWSYTYSPRGELIRATTSGFSQTLSYNKLGSIQTNSLVANGSAYSYAANNPLQLRNVGGSSLTYNGNGALTRNAASTYIWDSSRRLSRVLTPEVDTDYLYDGESNRVKKTTVDNEGNETETFYFGESFEYNPSTCDFIDYISIGTLPVALRTATKVEFLHSNHLGSTALRVDSEGNVLSVLSYRPFGENLQEGASLQVTRGYTSERRDENGLFYLHARYFDPTMGRFISPDPTVPSSDSVGLNRYSYALNDPINNEDRSGYGPGSWFGGAMSNLSYFGSSYARSFSNQFQTGMNYGGRVANEAAYFGRSYGRYWNQQKAVAHTTLETTGNLPALGIVPDAINTAAYALERDWGNATTSLAQMVPGFGQAVTAGKYGKRLGKIGELAANVSSYMKPGYSISGHRPSYVLGVAKESMEPSFNGAWIQRGLRRTLRKYVGPVEEKKFVEALPKGIVPPKGHAGNKVLNRDGFEFELKINGSSHRLGGNRNPQGVIIYTFFKHGGWH